MTRHPLGSINKDDMTDGDSEHIDWIYALAPADGDVIGRTIDSQPDVYMVNLNGNSTALLSLTLEAIPVPGLPFTPAASPYETGLCFQGQYSVDVPWYFIPSPWRPWKFCYAMANPVYVDGKNSGLSFTGSARADFQKFMITTEDGTRYVFGQPSLSEVYFPRDDLSPTQYDYQRLVSTWRLTAILSSNYSYLTADEMPTSSSPGGWVKIEYQTIDDINGTTKVVDTIETACCSPGHLFAQITYPYKIETPTHYAIFETQKRYDLDLAHDPDGTRRDYNRLLSKIKLYRKGDPNQLINEVAFTYRDNGALSLSTPAGQTEQMLSKLALDKITLKGFQGAVGDSLPTYKLSYNDTTVSWFSVSHAWTQPFVPLQVDDFGFYHHNSGSYSPDKEGPMWSLKEIVYPNGGRHVITYESDALNSTGLTYNKYTSNSYGPGIYETLSGNFNRLKEGGARVKSIKKYNGYNSVGDSIKFSYGPGRPSAIPELWFRKNYEDPISTSMYSSGERGQAAVTYDWIEKTFPDDSRIKTFYEIGDGTPEPATLYKITNAQFAILQSNTRWNWGEVKKAQYFAANGVISGNRVQEEIYNFSYRGHSDDANPIKIATVAPAMDMIGGATTPINLNFTHKQLDRQRLHQRADRLSI